MLRPAQHKFITLVAHLRKIRLANCSKESKIYTNKSKIINNKFLNFLLNHVNLHGKVNMLIKEKQNHYCTKILKTTHLIKKLSVKTDEVTSICEDRLIANILIYP